MNDPQIVVAKIMSMRVGQDCKNHTCYYTLILQLGNHKATEMKAVAQGDKITELWS